MKQIVMQALISLIKDLSGGDLTILFNAVKYELERRQEIPNDF